MLRQTAAVVFVLFSLEVPVSGQSSVKVAWDLEATHDQTGTGVVSFEADVDGVIVPCQNLVVLSTERQCELAVHPGSTTVKLRAKNVAGTSVYSNAVVADLPGLATVTFVSDVEVVPPTGGVVAAYGFNEGTGTSVNGVGPVGVISGATWVGGKFGQALSFNGTNQMVNVGSVNMTGSFTVTAWMQMRALQAGCCNSLVMKANDYGFELYQGKLWGRVGNGSDWTASPSVAITAGDLNVWKHAALTYDGTTARLYLDGALVSSATGTHTINASPLLVGSWDTRIEFWNGLVDEVRVYDKALNQSEVQADMTVPVP